MDEQYNEPLGGGESGDQQRDRNQFEHQIPKTSAVMACRRMLTEALVFMPHALARLATSSKPRHLASVSRNTRDHLSCRQLAGTYRQLRRILMDFYNFFHSSFFDEFSDLISQLFSK